MRSQPWSPRAFGLRGARIDLAPGMTVVAGPNESGKSTWHAALPPGSPGLKRGRGRARLWTRRSAPSIGLGTDPMTGRSRPASCSTTAALSAARQDLAGKVGCSALDVGLRRGRVARDPRWHAGRITLARPGSRNLRRDALGQPGSDHGRRRRGGWAAGADATRGRDAGGGRHRGGGDRAAGGVMPPRRGRGRYGPRRGAAAADAAQARRLDRGPRRRTGPPR